MSSSMWGETKVMVGSPSPVVGLDWMISAVFPDLDDSVMFPRCWEGGFKDGFGAGGMRVLASPYVERLHNGSL